jgi:hypothetical protein
MRKLKQQAFDRALTAGCSQRAARYAAHRAAYWADWHDLPAERAIHNAVRDGQIHDEQRAISVAMAGGARA